MLGPESIDWNPYDPRIELVFQLKPKLGYGPRRTNKSKLKISFKTNF